MIKNNKQVQTQLDKFLGLDQRLKVSKNPPVVTGATTLTALKKLMDALEAQGLIKNETTV